MLKVLMKKVRANCTAAETALYTNVAASGIVAAKLALDGNIFTKAISIGMGSRSRSCWCSKWNCCKRTKMIGQTSWYRNRPPQRETQSFNTETMDMYDEEIITYDGHMTGVEDLELEIPDDVEAPEDTALPPTTGDGLPEETPETTKPDKKEDEE